MPGKQNGGQKPKSRAEKNKKRRERKKQARMVADVDKKILARGTFSDPQSVRFVTGATHPGGGLRVTAKSRGLNGVVRNVKGGLSAVESRVYDSLIMPLEYPPLRWATMYRSMRTAVAAPWRRLAVQYANDSTPSQRQLPTGQAFFSFHRSMLRCAVISDGTLLASVYRCVQVLAGSLGGTTTVSLPVTGPAPNVSYLNVDLLKANWNSGYNPHGPVLYPGITNDRPGMKFFWIDSKTGASTWTFTFSVGLVAGATFRLWRWDNGIGPAPVLTNNPGVGVGFTTFTIPSSGYYGVDYSTPGAIVCTSVDISLTGTDFFSHLACPGIEQNLAAVQGVNITTFAAQITNKAPWVDMAGEIALIQSPQGVQWYDYAMDGFDAVAGAQGAVNGDAKLGGYAFIKPTMEDDFKIRNPILVEDDTLKSCNFDLENPSAFLAFFLRIAGVNGRDFFLIHGMHLDYQTLDTWRPIQAPSIDYKIFDEVIGHLKDINNLHENPTHASKLLKKVKELAAKGERFVESTVLPAWKIGKLLMEAAG